MKLQIVNMENAQVGELEASDLVFNLPVRKDIVARVVQWQLDKRRSGSHNVKNKSDVHGTTRKFVRQKGSGGARHGSKKAAQFRGGGIVFGPINRDHGYSLPKKIRKLGLKIMLSNKAQTGNLVVIDSFKPELFSKTKNFIKQFGNYKSALFINDNEHETLLRVINNVPGFDVLKQIGANVYDLLKHEKLIMSVDTVKALEGRLL